MLEERGLWQRFFEGTTCFLKGAQGDNIHGQPEVSSGHFQPQVSSGHFQPEVSSGNFQPEVSSGYFQPEVATREHKGTTKITRRFFFPDLPIIQNISE